MKFEIEQMIHEEISRGNQISEEGVELRIADVERALRAQQAQNRIIQNQYDNLMNQLEGSVRKTIQVTLL